MERGAFVATVDVEDWAQSTWDRSLPVSERAERNTDRLLELLARRGARVTMFVLGRLAERFPDLVRRIAAAGHEIGSHGWGHVEVFRQGPEAFREDVTRAKAFLEDLSGAPVVGYRAPDFSIVRSSRWALDILADTGHLYDSSIFPIRHGRYGIREWPQDPRRVRLASGRSIVELPVATLEFVGVRLPVAGGGYHRLLPGAAIRAAVRTVIGAGRPFVAYCHPYELDPHEMANLDLPWKVKLHQGLGRRSFASKLDALLASFTTGLARDVALGRAWPDHRLVES